MELGVVFGAKANGSTVDTSVAEVAGILDRRVEANVAHRQKPHREAKPRRRDEVGVIGLEAEVLAIGVELSAHPRGRTQPELPPAILGEPKGQTLAWLVGKPRMSVPG